MKGKTSVKPCGIEGCALTGESPLVMDGGVAYHRCPRCAALRSPDSAILRREVEPDATATTPLSMRVLFFLRTLWLRLCVPAFSARSARVLDCGCGDGQWLEWMRDQGFSTLVGMETNPDRRRRVHERGLTGHASLTEAAAAVPGGQFDLIFLWHVLEHVDQPVTVLRDLVDLLAPGGALVVSLPNHGSLQTRLFGSRSAFVSYGHHVWFIDHGYFGWLRGQMPDISIQPVTDLNLEYEVFGWLDTLVSKIFGHDNLLHGALKKGSVTGSARLKALALAGLLLPLAGLASLISLAIPRAGSTMTYLFRRR